MDLHKVIRELQAEKKRIEDAIASIEELIAAKVDPESIVSGALNKRRGRKSMPPEERSKVAERMKRYWARQRASTAKAPGGGPR